MTPLNGWFSLFRHLGHLVYPDGPAKPIFMRLMNKYIANAIAIALALCKGSGMP